MHIHGIRPYALLNDCNHHIFSSIHSNSTNHIRCLIDQRCTQIELISRPVTPGKRPCINQAQGTTRDTEHKCPFCLVPYAQCQMMTRAGAYNGSAQCSDGYNDLRCHGSGELDSPDLASHVGESASLSSCIIQKIIFIGLIRPVQ